MPCSWMLKQVQHDGVGLVGARHTRRQLVPSGPSSSSMPCAFSSSRMRSASAKFLALRASLRASIFSAINRRKTESSASLFSLDLSQRRSNPRSEEHTSELQSLMRTSYAVFCLTKKNTHTEVNT